MNLKIVICAAIAASVSAASATAQQPPALAPVQRCFLTYFPAGSAEFPQAGASVVQSAVTYAGAAGAVKVTAHRDGAESDDVSLLRAAAVVQALVNGGVARNRITTDSAGFSKPAVPSQGAEPLNRRVEMCVTPAAS